MIRLLQDIFANKLIDDNRIDDPIFTFEVPVFGGKTCSFIPPDFAFYYQLVSVLVIQSTFNAILGFLVYKIVIEPQKVNRKVNVLIATPYLFAFGLAIPFVVMEPIFLMGFLDIKNVGLKMVILATPIVNSLRITEAVYGFTPFGAKQNLFNYVVYFSCAFGITFDSVTGNPKRVSRKFFLNRVKTLGRDFVIVSFIISILKQYDYAFFDTTHKAHSMEHSLQELFSWQHLLNNFLVALLVSASLSQSSLGVSIVYNIVYGFETCEIVQNPMFKSTSVSEFWGRRWNLLVHQGLKNGVYKPTRKYTSSKLLGVFATFAASGIIHEYVNFVLFDSKTYDFAWKQMIFFGWNGVLLALEYCIGHWAIFKWMTRNLPQIVITALILCCALPLAHLFTGDWIRHGYFDAVYLAEPIVVCT